MENRFRRIEPLYRNPGEISVRQPSPSVTAAPPIDANKK